MTSQENIYLEKTIARKLFQILWILLFCY